MIFHLLEHLTGFDGVFNVFRYQTFRAIMASLTAFLLCFFMAPLFIRQMRKRQVGQEVRDDGPQSHLSKQGTPTMGGAFILAGLVMSTLAWSRLDQPYVWLVISITLGYGTLGFIDDYKSISDRAAANISQRFNLNFAFFNVHF